MRKFTIITVMCVVALTLTVLHYRPNAKTIPEQLETALSYAHMLTYRDSLFGYVVHYPDFFEQSDCHNNEPGYSQFTYWGKVEMELTTFILPNEDELTAKEGMDSIGKALHATTRHLQPNSFILSGSIYQNGQKLTGRCFHAKFVRHRKVWFVQTLVYPEGCDRAVKRITRQIDKWKIWEQCVSFHLPNKHTRRFVHVGH